MKKCNESCSGCRYLRKKVLKGKILYAAWCDFYKKDVHTELKNSEEYKIK